MLSFFNNKKEVSIFTLQIPSDNEKLIDDFVKEFGNIPKYSRLEGGDSKGCLYLFCIDSSINYKKIIADYDYKHYYHNMIMKIDKKLYNNKYQIFKNYSKNLEPYILEELE